MSAAAKNPATVKPSGALHARLKSLSSFLRSGAIYHSGTIPLPRDGVSLFYASQKGHGNLHVPGASDVDIERLIQACDPASFGRNQEDVLDESYRKAWKLDTAYFASQFTLPHTLCVEVVELMLGGLAAQFTLDFELYKLNIYGPGSFFKAHVDTPRQTNMIGSLVVVLPTEHEGGDLVLRHGGVERTFDSAKMVSLDPLSPLAAFTVFYSDVEHEVLPVTSGHRRTLTYNLYKVTSQHTLIPNPSKPMDNSLDSSKDMGVDSLKADVKAILGYSRFLPKGGFLVFHLAHKCIMKTTSFWGKLDDRVTSLKGIDALLYHVLHNVLALECSFQLLSEFERDDRLSDSDSESGYKEVKYQTLSASIPVVGGADEDDLYHRVGGSHVWNAGTGIDAKPRCEKNGTYYPAVWVGNFHPLSARQKEFITYGHEATADSIYQKVCLVVEVGSASDRARV